MDAVLVAVTECGRQCIRRIGRWRAIELQYGDNHVLNLFLGRRPRSDNRLFDFPRCVTRLRTLPGLAFSVSS